MVSRLPVTAVFLTLGAAVGTWAARVPAFKGALHLSAGGLGLVLLGPAVGTVLAMPATGALLATVAPRHLVRAGLLAMAGLLPLTTFAGSGPQLFAVLVGWGVGIGVVDVSMNTEAAAVQQRLGRRVMSTFHASYSIGGLLGAGLGAAAAAAGISVRVEFAFAAALAFVLGQAGARSFDARPMPVHREPSEAGSEHERPLGRSPQWSLRLAALAAMAFACFLCEGATSNWSAVYLRSSLGASPGVAALAYTLFSCTMTAGRLFGDRGAERLGPVFLVRCCAGLAAGGFAAALIIGQVWSGLVGFLVLGAGLSVVVPLVLSSASALGRAGPNLAVVSGCGYSGMLVGPAVIGGLAALAGLPAALGSVVALSALTALLAGVLKGRPAGATPRTAPSVAP